MGLAVVHIVGALGVSFAFGILVILIGAWEQEHVQKRRLQDAAVALGVPVASLETDADLTPRLIEYSSQRVSSELLRNRLSDLCGLLRTLWGGLGTLLQLGIVVAVGWAMFTEGSSNAPFMWGVLAVAVFFWLASVVFSFLCLVLTGRYPGEAKATRKAIAKASEAFHASKTEIAGTPMIGTLRDGGIE